MTQSTRLDCNTCIGERRVGPLRQTTDSALVRAGVESATNNTKKRNQAWGFTFTTLMQGV